ncbi:MAG: single-stranded-DNA-specific exonuclease RecJ [Chloroflexi bacterium]|nr:MAG: single-stranded-DNA-specific exonuclease RecJ [Chloroflexota bacterium]
MRSWITPPPIEIPAEFADSVGGHPLVAEILYRRGLRSPDEARRFLDPDLYTPCSPTEMPGIGQAADRVEEAIRKQEPVCVWGDFDVDGQTSTTLLVSALTSLGACVSYHIPNRATESHGVHMKTLIPLLDNGIRLLLTCDTGITANECVAYAKERGVDFVITDHHILPERLPDAVAVANPRLLTEGHPLEALPGVGVAYLLAAELYRRAGRVEEALEYLDLVALGIVADVASQKDDTRYLLQRGLQSFKNTRRVGLQMMMELAGISKEWPTEEHIAFYIAPRLNALGRLGDASSAVEFLTTTNPTRARMLAVELEGLNSQRKLLTGQVYQGAIAQIERDPSLLQDPVLVLSHPSWPSGVVGIVASRVVEQFGRPAVLISSPPGELARGSARSVAGCDITQAIASQAHLLEGFGGHPMAAGLSLSPDRIPEFRRSLCRSVESVLGKQIGPIELPIDGYLPIADLNLDLIRDLERLAPFGAGNPSLTLCARDLASLTYTPIGRNGEHLQLIVEDREGNTRRVMWWQAGDDVSIRQLEGLREGFDLAYHVRSSSYRGQLEVQVEWVEACPKEVKTIEVKARETKIIDLRCQPYPLAALQTIIQNQEVQVWCEAEAVQKLAQAGITGLDRCSLQKGPSLVIWSIPPGPHEVRDVIDRVQPVTVTLIGIHPAAADTEGFLKRITGLVKYAMSHKGGNIQIRALAAAAGQREILVRKGLTWLEQKGYIRIMDEGEDKLRLTKGTGESLEKAALVLNQIALILEETAAYREFFLRADAASIIHK